MELVYIGVATILVTLVFCIYEKKRRRSQRQVRSNCWCCGRAHSMKAYESNNWICKGCDQFNGFTPEGDIEVYAETNKNGMNRYQERESRFCMSVKAPAQYEAPQLCPRCRALPEVKARLLREFSEAFEDNEYADYEGKLEKEYQRCIYCQTKVESYYKIQQKKYQKSTDDQREKRFPGWLGW